MSHECDVAIIGAGLIGCAAAFYLTGKGQRVVVVDQDEINRGASGRNAGSLHFQIEPRMVDMLVSNPEKLSELIPVNLRAIEDWRGLASELDCELEIAMQGGLMVAETDAELRLLERKIELETRAGLSVTLLSSSDLRRVAPCLSKKIRFASFCPDEGHANPRLIASAYAARARARSVQFRLKTQVLSIEAISDAWRLILKSPEAASSGGKMHLDARKVLVAAGAWSRKLLLPLGVEVPLTAVGLQMMVTQRTDRLITHLIQHVGRRLSIKQVEAGNILIGGGWPARLAAGELAGATDATLEAASMIGSSAVACQTVPATSRLSIIRSWSGIACIAPDHLPVLGPVVSLPGVFIAAGGSSFTLGPTYAKLISELIVGATPSMPLGLYRAERFARARLD